MLFQQLFNLKTKQKPDLFIMSGLPSIFVTNSTYKLAMIVTCSVQFMGVF